jgi:hypothetical protein
MEILRWIDRGIVDPDLIVQVRAGAVSRRADVTQDVSAANVLPGDHRETG